MDGTVAWGWDPEPFGNSQPTGTLTYNHRFPGQYYDRETGLHHNGNRDYDKAGGRYNQSDPLGLAAGFNTYAYVRNNPLVLSDPLGLAEQGQAWGGALGGITGTFVGASFFGGPLGAPAGALIGTGLGVVAGDIIEDALSGGAASAIHAGGQKMCSATDGDNLERW